MLGHRCRLACTIDGTQLFHPLPIAIAKWAKQIDSPHGHMHELDVAVASGQHQLQPSQVLMGSSSIRSTDDWMRMREVSSFRFVWCVVWLDMLVVAGRASIERKWSIKCVRICFFLGRATRREKNFVFLCSVGLLLMVLSYYDDCFVCVFGLIGTFDAILMGIVYYWCGDDGDCSGWCQLTSLSIIVYHRRKVGIDWCGCGWFRMAKRHKRNGHKSIQD